MVKTVNFVTSNKDKVEEADIIGLDYSLTFSQIELSLPELRSDNPEEIALYSAKLAFARYGKPIIVEDSGLFIDALKEFPGTCSAYIFKRIGNEGILRLMRYEEDKTAHMKSAVAYCDGKSSLSFLGSVSGEISKKVKGEHGFGYDPIFIPEGHDKTYGEDPEHKKKVSHRMQSVRKFCEWYTKRM
jgi:XTP/dITP diphosphohydrolase